MDIQKHTPETTANYFKNYAVRIKKQHLKTDKFMLTE